MTSPTYVIYPIPPLSSKREHSIAGADLIITYHSDLAQCQILPTGARYTSAGNFNAGTLVQFVRPTFIDDLYPGLLSAREEESIGLPVLLSMFNPDVRSETLEKDWEGKWFTIIARLFPNQLTFDGVSLDGWETEETGSVQVSLAMPRDGGLIPYVLSLRNHAAHQCSHSQVSSLGSSAVPMEMPAGPARRPTCPLPVLLIWTRSTSRTAFGRSHWPRLRCLYGLHPTCSRRRTVVLTKASTSVTSFSYSPWNNSPGSLCLVGCQPQQIRFPEGHGFQAVAASWGSWTATLSKAPSSSIPPSASL
jgi:hypothetical protein